MHFRVRISSSMKRQIVLLSMALILAALVWLVPWPLLRYGLGFVLLWVLPGLSWVFLVPRQVLDRAERLVVGLGLNFVITPLIALLLVYLPGPATRVAFLAAAVGIIGLPVIVSVAVHLRRTKVTVQEVQQADDGPLTRSSLPMMTSESGFEITGLCREKKNLKLLKAMIQILTEAKAMGASIESSLLKLATHAAAIALTHMAHIRFFRFKRQLIFPYQMPLRNAMVNKIPR